ncbi:unnamed protein product [Ixodes persulcatus]
MLSESLFWEVKARLLEFTVVVVVFLGGRTSRFPLAATLPRSFRAVRQGRVSCSDALARWRRTRRGSSPLAGFLDPYWDLVLSRADWAKDVIPWDLFLRSEVGVTSRRFPLKDG